MEVHVVSPRAALLADVDVDVADAVAAVVDAEVDVPAEERMGVGAAPARCRWGALAVAGGSGGSALKGARMVLMCHKGRWGVS